MNKEQIQKAIYDFKSILESETKNLNEQVPQWKNSISDKMKKFKRGGLFVLLFLVLAIFAQAYANMSKSSETSQITQNIASQEDPLILKNTKYANTANQVHQQPKSDTPQKTQPTQNETQQEAKAITPAATSAPPTEETSQTKQIQRSNQTQGGFLANTKSGKYHRATCRTIRNPNAAHFVRYNTAEECIAAGYKACKVCL